MPGNYYGMSFNPFDRDIATTDAFLTGDMKEMNGRLDYLKNNPGIGVFYTSETDLHLAEPLRP